MLDKCRKFFCVAHFGAAIHVFSARLGAASWCCNFAFCSTTYVRPLSHLSLLAFVTFVFFTLRCYLFFLLRCQLYIFINSCAFSYCLSFLLPDEASGRNVVRSTVCCSTVCCSLNLYTSILFVLDKCPNIFSVAHFGAAILLFNARFGVASCCYNFAFCSTTYVRPLSHLSLLAFDIFVIFTLRCHLFSYFAVLFFFLLKIMRFLILSFIFLTWCSLWAKLR